MKTLLKALIAGKAAGQNGFKLSLLGFDAPDDYERLVKESRGRRVSPAAPDRSRSSSCRAAARAAARSAGSLGGFG